MVGSERKSLELVRSVISTSDEDMLEFVEFTLVKHILKLTNYSQYSKELASLLPTKTRKDLRNSIIHNFEVLVSMKCAILEIFKLKAFSSQQQVLIYKRWGVHPSTLNIVKQLIKEKHTTALCSIANGCTFSSNTPLRVRNECGAMIVGFETSIIKYVYAKMRFILAANGMTADELVDELKLKAFLTFYAEYPFKTGAYLLNTVNKAWRNRGTNLIKWYTASKRTRLEEDGAGGFQTTCIGIDTNQGFENSHIFDNSSDGVTLEETTINERSMNLQMLKSKMSKAPRKAKTLDLLTFTFDADFIVFLKQHHPKRIRETHDLEDVYNIVGHDNYVEGIRQYMNVPTPTFNTFLLSLRSAI